MVRIVKTEFYKLKRYHILWAGVALMLLSVLLTLFTSMANDGSVWDFSYLIEQVIKNNMSMIFPMCISLIAGYMISREQTDDTLKNILTVPISFKRLLTGKLIVCGVLSIIFGLICSLFTIIAELLVGFPGFRVTLALKSILQITAVNFFLYLAVLPIIVITCRKAGQLFSGCYYCLCLWIWRYVCRRKYDFSKYLSDYGKSWNGRVSQLRYRSSLEYHCLYV